MTDPNLTHWERSILAMPAYLPGLLRRGSPVFWRDEATPWTVTWIGPWPDSDSTEDGAIVLAAPSSVPCLGIEDNWTNFVLDLTDATGRAHLAWWVAGRIRTHFGGHLDPTEGVRWHRSWRGHWELHCQRADEHRKWQEVCFLPWDGDDDLSDHNAGPHSTWTRFTPTLDRLDPNDPRLLPDGSRVVDALALGLVGRHVAGLAVPDVDRG